MRPAAIILNGASSSGKTSLARALQRLAPDPMLHASLDSFVDMFLWEAIPDTQLRRQCHAVGVSNFHRTLPLLAAGDFPMVVDHVFERVEWFEETMAALAVRPICLVGVRCPLSVLEERERLRGDRRIGMARAQHETVHRDRIYNIEVDTSVVAPDEGAAMILAFLESTGPGVSA